jgi:hypothetical protein
MPPVTELDVLRTRRELVLVSAELQRATIVRRVDHIERHPVHYALGFAASAATVPVLIKVGSLVARRVARPDVHMSSTEKRRFSVLALLPLLRFVPAIKAALPRIRSINRRR